MTSDPSYRRVPPTESRRHHGRGGAAPVSPAPAGRGSAAPYIDRTEVLAPESPQQTPDTGNNTRQSRQQQQQQQVDITAVPSPSPSPPPPPLTRKPTYLRRSPGIFGAWGFELVSIIFSIGCLAAMIVLLTRLDGQTLSSWTLPIVSPNTLIAILSTAAKTSMILPVAECISQLKWIYLEKRAITLHDLQPFDDSTRGPWGALLFFFNSKNFWRRGAAYITYIGCIVTIASLAWEPFTQQLITFTELPTRVEGERSVVTRSQIYDWDKKFIFGKGLLMRTTRDKRVEGAAVGAMYGNVGEPPLSCPGSNCTYPTFTSIGVEGRCNDVTALTVQNCTRRSSTEGSIICYYHLPSGPQLRANAAIESRTTADIVVQEPAQYPQFYDGHLMNFSMGLLDTDYPENLERIENNTDWQNSMRAYKCDFAAVAYTYHGWASTNGTIRPGTIVTSRLNKTNGFNNTVCNYEALDPTFPGNKTFIVNWQDMFSMMHSLERIFSAAADDALYNDGATYRDALAYSSNATAVIENVGRAMSFQMLSGPNATAVYGDVFAMQTFMHVHWPWLTLTLTLMTLTAILFVIVVVQTSVMGQKAWKSSLAPMLYRGEEGLLVGKESYRNASNESVRITDGGGGIWEVPEGYHMARSQTIVSQLKP